MILTNQLKEIIIVETTHYAKVLKIKRVPDLCFELIPFHKDSQNTKQWGHYYHADQRLGRLIYLNIKKHKNMAELLYTIVHELVHVRYPNLKHGVKFEQLVEQTLKKDSIAGLKTVESDKRPAL